jgi:hypothetical protein
MSVVDWKFSWNYTMLQILEHSPQNLAENIAVPFSPKEQWYSNDLQLITGQRRPAKKSCCEIGDTEPVLVGRVLRRAKMGLSDLVLEKPSRVGDCCNCCVRTEHLGVDLHSARKFGPFSRVWKQQIGGRYFAGAVLLTVIVVRIAWHVSFNAALRWRNRRFGFDPPRPSLRPTVGSGVIISWAGMRALSL